MLLRAFKTIIKSDFWYIAFLMLLPLALVSVFQMVEFQNVVANERKIQPQFQVQTAFSILEHFHILEAQKKLTKEEAQTQAKNVIRKLRYNGDEYFWINDMNGTLLVHPYRAEYENQNVLAFKDSKGKKLFVEIIHFIEHENEGFLTYHWNKPGSSNPSEKTSFVRKFEPWGWVIGSGVFVSDIDKNIIDVFRVTIFTSIIVFLISLVLISRILHGIEIKILRSARQQRLLKDEDYIERL